MSRSLRQQLKGLCRGRRQGSFATQDTRRRILELTAADLKRLGYTNMRLSSLSQRHVWALVHDWQARDLSLSTQKNRTSALRWWAKQVGREEQVAKTNDHYGIGERSYVAQQSKAVELTPERLERVSNPWVRLALRLQKLFGLRREESMKFQVKWADRGGFIRLKSSWCKGGRERDVPVRDEKQRALLEDIRSFTGGGDGVSLIPPELRYVEQKKRYEYAVQKAGLSRMHGLRHAYAQQRYRELTGWECPVKGGPRKKDMSSEDQKKDFEVRMAISRELGHGREEITAVYLGR